jgi:hypothetical protein
VTDFTNGGSQPTTSAYEWKGNAPGSLDTTAAGSGAGCGSAPDDLACAIVNRFTPLSPSWPFTTKGSDQTNAFVEGGVNLRKLFGDNVPRFSSFLAETRSSQEVTATLKDFAGGPINTCGSITIHKQATPADDTSFAFTTTNSQGADTLGSFNLKDPSDPTKAFTNVKKGTYTVTESASGSWSLDDLTCTTSGPGTSFAVDKPNRKATITLGYGGHADCTYVNKHDQGYLKSARCSMRRRRALPARSQSSTTAAPVM